MKPHEVQEKLGLTRIRDRVWYVQPSCATTGDGLYEGLMWLTANNKSWILLLYIIVDVFFFNFIWSFESCLPVIRLFIKSFNYNYLMPLFGFVSYILCKQLKLNCSSAIEFSVYLSQHEVTLYIQNVALHTCSFFNLRWLQLFL